MQVQTISSRFQNYSDWRERDCDADELHDRVVSCHLDNYVECPSLAGGFRVLFPTFKCLGLLFFIFKNWVIFHGTNSVRKAVLETTRRDVPTASS